MSRFRVAYLAGPSTVLLFLHLSRSLERHSLVERPRLSLLLVFLVAGIACFIASLFSKWLPESRGNFTTSYKPLDRPTLGTTPDETLPQHRGPQLPDRPGRLLFAALVLCIAVRTNVFHWVNHHQQCAAPGIEAYLCVAVFVYDTVLTKRNWTSPVSKDLDDPWRSVFDDVVDWFNGARVAMVCAFFGSLIFSFGTSLALGQFPRSSYFCFDLVDSRAKIVSTQWLGVVLDAAIIVLFWRINAWIKNTNTRLRAVSFLLLLSCLCMGVIGIVDTASNGVERRDPVFGSLSTVDVITDGVVLASLFVSASFWFLEHAPLAPVSTITVLISILTSLHNIGVASNQPYVSRAAAVMPLWVSFGGSILFLSSQDVRSFLFIPRAAFGPLFAVLVVAASIYASAHSAHVFQDRHPIDMLISNAMSNHDAWLKQAKMSTSRGVAAETYREQHGGRSPPPQFDRWYDYAKGSSVIDQFQQIDQDLSPFWDLQPKEIRARVDLMLSHPGTTFITIEQGEVRSGNTKDEGEAQDLEELAQMIKKFSKHLPDMTLPINLMEAPRILPSWDDVFSQSLTDIEPASKLASRGIREEVYGAMNLLPGQETIHAMGLRVNNASLTRDFAQMHTRGCPPSSRARTRPHWRFRELCLDCMDTDATKPWDSTLDVCQQPDLNHLHGFFMFGPQEPPIEKLLPLFGPSKISGFRDILMPLPKSRLEKPDNSRDFSKRYDAFFWSGTAGQQPISNHALRGDHKYRFLHLIGNPDAQEQVTVILPRSGSQNVFSYERVEARKASITVPFAARLEELDACIAENCQLLQQAYGGRDVAVDPLGYRYVLLLDEDRGPPTQLLRTLRSNSVPFVSTIFRSWYTERLTPWLHFVPIDLRFQALHTTLAYFSGTEDRPPMTKTTSPMKAQTKNAQWIAEQGQKWAEQAFGQKDMEIYLFRLLMEWGRLISDNRDQLGFRTSANGVE
jgi:hypothetical protein